ncbi:DUF736 domain-containing protein [Hyphococcus formosus]|uniref:DUF736 domain-containing protein n=1 Tax=Hyphococcus formosus TaxID=3143534 RepID=UPI00398B9F69
MSTIGKLKLTKDQNGEFLTGYIQTLEINLQIRLYPIKEQASANSPSHRIFAIGKDNAEIEIGAAWTKTMSNPDRFGEEFLSISIDDPSLPQALNVAAFKEENSETYAITFRRRMAKA